MSFDPSLTLSESVVETAVADLCGDWSVVEVTGRAGSANDRFVVEFSTDAGGRAAVCKCCSGTEAETFRPEPYLLATLEARTNIPVPSVLAVDDDHDEVGGPLFLMERCGGGHPTDDARALDRPVLERIAEDAGRYLGELHGVGSFERFGSVQLQRDVNHERGGIECAPEDLPGQRQQPPTITTEDDAPDEWRDRFRGLTDFFVENFDERFADLRDPVREALDDRIDVLGGEAPVLTHNDYTYWNVLVDVDTGETTAVLDFENKWTAPAECNLAATVDNLSALAPLDSPRRRRVREALYAGYEETNALDRGGEFEARRELYRLAARLSSLTFFESGLVVGPDDPDALEREHREFVRRFC